MADLTRRGLNGGGRERMSSGCGGSDQVGDIADFVGGAIDLAKLPSTEEEAIELAKSPSMGGEGAIELAKSPSTEGGAIKFGEIVDF